MHMMRLFIMALLCYSLFATSCYAFEDTVSKQERGRSSHPVEVDRSDLTEETGEGVHLTGKEKAADKPVESTAGSKKKEERGSAFVPSEKIPADQAVDFPADI